VCTEGIVYIIKGDTSAKGDIVSVRGESKNPNMYSYYLEEPHPNPFNSSTIISWQMHKSGTVAIHLFDITGREIAELLNEERTSGKNQIEFNAEKYKLSSGIYFIQMQIKSHNNKVFTQTKKLSYIK
jgi:hypothetical protein